MNFKDFRQSLTATSPPEGLSEYATALWYDAKKEWDKSHNLIQDIPDADASWIHAYLHRKEGDTINADYWYRKAGRQRPSVSLEEEWEQLVTAFL